MTRVNPLQHTFVDCIPEVLIDGVIYVSIRFTTVKHKCCCGCGTVIVTPLDPTDWKITYDGETVSLFPSIGNWSLACQSHYWIQQNQVRWARHLSKHEIEAGRARDRFRKSKRLSDACIFFWRYLVMWTKNRGGRQKKHHYKI